MKAQMFIIAAIFLVGLAFFVQQALFRYSSLDISEPMRTNDYYAFRSMHEMISYTTKSTRNCESGKDNFRQNLGEIESLLSKEGGTMSYITSISYSLNCSNWDNDPPDPSPLDLTLYTTGLGTETKGSFNIDNCCTQSAMLLYFDEGAGSLTKDSSCNRNNGNINGSTWTTNGKIGNALNFDGVDDYVNVTNSPSLNISGNQITLAAWIKPGSSTGRVIVGKPHASTHISPYFKYLLYYDAGSNPRQIAFRITTTGGSSKVVRSGAGNTCPEGTWCYVAGTYNGSVMKVFLDGTERYSDSKTGNIETSDQNLFIGQNVAGTERFNGTIDEVVVYNRVLSQAEIQQHYNSGHPPC